MVGYGDQGRMHDRREIWLEPLLLSFGWRSRRRTGRTSTFDENTLLVGLRRGSATNVAPSNLRVLDGLGQFEGGIIDTRIRQYESPRRFSRLQVMAEHLGRNPRNFTPASWTAVTVSQSAANLRPSQRIYLK